MIFFVGAVVAIALGVAAVVIYERAWSNGWDAAADAYRMDEDDG